MRKRSNKPTELDWLVAPMAIWRIRDKIAYCNRMIIPRLLKLKIDWDMTPMRIIFCGRVFPMRSIDDGEAEAFIDSLVDECGQCKLVMFN